jgi:aryl-alcohol dehydrogenase-like predicted oxidoreductase
VSTVILGASKTSQLEENLDTLDKAPLTAEIIERIESVLKNKPIPPAW